jgi:hypothetical protein
MKIKRISTGSVAAGIWNNTGRACSGCYRDSKGRAGTAGIWVGNGRISTGSVAAGNSERLRTGSTRAQHHDGGTRKV